MLGRWVILEQSSNVYTSTFFELYRGSQPLHAMSHRLACVPLLQEPSTPQFYQCPLIFVRMFLCVLVLGRWRSAPQLNCSGVGLQSLIQWAPKFVSLRVIVNTHFSSRFNVHCSSFIGPTLGTKVCHLLYLTQQPVTNWAIYTGLALGWARDLHYLRGWQQCSWVSIRALDLQRREELQAISLSGVVRCWGGEFTRTPIPLQFWRIQTLNLKIAFIVTPKTGLMVQLVRNLRKHWKHWNSPITSA